jgi:hypothetical protein
MLNYITEVFLKVLESKAFQTDFCGTPTKTSKIKEKLSKLRTENYQLEG